MIRLILRRLIAVIPTLLIVTFMTFLLVKLTPADPATTAAGGLEATPAEIATVREELHLNDPLLSQYWRWPRTRRRATSRVLHQQALGDRRPAGPGSGDHGPDPRGDGVALIIAIPLGILGGSDRTASPIALAAAAARSPYRAMSSRPCSWCSSSP
jgi:hypothetical protein